MQDDQRPPFDPEPKGLKPAEDRRKEDQSTRSRAPIRVDLAGIERRVAAFPVAEGRFGQIAGTAGKVLWTTFPIPGAHGRGGHKESPGRLELFDFATLRTEPLLERADSFALAADHVTLVVRDGKRLRAIRANARPEGKEPPSSDEPSRKTGWIDLARIRLSVEPRLEWRQMLREVWRLQRDQFWVANMSGTDWDAIYRRYEPLLARVATRGELSDLIWEMQGELGTSHAYEMGGDHRRPPQIALGHLAADLRVGGWRGGVRDRAHRRRRRVGRGGGLAAERDRRAGRRSANASSRSTASRSRASGRRRRCSCIRRARRWSSRWPRKAVGRRSRATCW